MAGVRPLKNRGSQREERFFDFTLLFVVLFLVVFGLLMIYSTSSYEAALDYGNAAYYLQRQAIAAILGVGAMIFVSRLPYRIWTKLDKAALLGSVILVALVLTPLGITRNGATRWLMTGIPGFNIQPAEVAKLGMIIYLASTVTKLGKKVQTRKGFAHVFVPPIVVAAMVYILTDNLSSAIIIMGIAVVMVFVSTPNYRVYILITLAIIAVAAAVIFYAVSLPDTEGVGFRLIRIKAWLDPESYSTDKAFQTLQALYAIGSGGLWGKGLGQSMQKLGYIPEAQNDMIFSIICEELGLFGAVAVIFLFIILIWRCMIIANNAEDLFGALLVVGVMGHFAIQVILNIAVVTNTIPNTGISLPFISYGGSSVLFLMIEIGIIFSVARGIRLKNL